MTQGSGVISLRDALKNLCSNLKTQSQEHIKPTHSYCATRLVLEGGFPPDWVKPQQGFSSARISNLEYRIEPATTVPRASEHRVLGGIKYKDVDVTVLVPGVGPALGISGKSTGGAFRNLTNRMEEALGECTNIHLMYPGFVFGFLHLIRFTKISEVENIQDASFNEKDEPLPPIRRYHDVLLALAGRDTITDPGMKYEAVGLLIYQCAPEGPRIWTNYPPKDSPVHFSKFFQRLLDLYDIRFGFPDPEGPNVRKCWHPKGLPSSFDRETPFPWDMRLADQA